MHLSYVEFDERLEAADRAALRAPERVRADFNRRYELGWIYHELSLEGVILTEDDLRRATAGLEGRDYCDSVLLDTVRNYRRAIERLRRAAARRERLSYGTLEEYHAILSGGPTRDARRECEGATEQYKHDVVAPEEIDPALDELLEELPTWSITRHPIASSIQLHFRLTRIWPYNRYSAAVARLAANQILVSAGLPPTVIHAIDRQRYYHALHYDVTKLTELVHESQLGQLELRERFFQVPVESRAQVRAY